MRFLLIVVSMVLSANMVIAGETVKLETQRDKVSYSIGMDIGNNLKRQSIDVDPELLSRGVRDVLSGGKLLMTEEQFRSTMTGFRKEMMAKQQSQLKGLGEKNSREGTAFLAENGKKEGVKTLPSGLQYKVQKEGDGDVPKLTDTVTVHYKGTLIDGTEFDSSYARGKPASFPVNGVIPGWTEALQLMKTGARWQLFIPANLAYGERGAGGKIGPNAALVFDVELLSIK